MNIMKAKYRILIIIIFLFNNVRGQIQIGTDIEGEAIGDNSGSSVDLNANGNILAVGAYENSDNGVWSGHVRVFERVNDDWVQIGDDIDGEAAGDKSGRSISLNRDGTILAIGAKNNDGSGSEMGHVRVYQRIGNDWLQLGQDIDGEADGDESGWQIDISDDGTILAIGAPGNRSGSGHIRIYKLNQNGIWIQMGEDIDGETTRDSTRSVAMNANGNIIAVGSPRSSINGSKSGNVKVYKWDGNNSWVQLGENIPGKQESDVFGTELTMNANGTILAVGSEFSGGDNRGNVRIYQWDEISSWIQLGQDIRGARTYSNFGSSVSLNNNGNVLAVGASAKNTSVGVGSGQVRIYKWDGTSNWRIIGNDINGREQSSGLGRDVSLNDEGSIVAVGGDYSVGYLQVYALDIESPSGYTIVIDQDAIDAENETTVSFTFAGAELGAIYRYTFTSSGDGNSSEITGNGTVTSVDQNVSGIDLSSLTDGTITLSVSLRDTSNNIGDLVMDTTVKNMTLGVDNLLVAELIKIYPNPTSGSVFITESMKKIEIHNIMGKKVFQTVDNDTSFDISFLTSGVYFITLTGDKGSTIKKLIKS